MAKKNKNPHAPSGVMLYAKESGKTSFSSLWSIKHALGTEKVGHTGTLDSFADGLLVVLTGNLTHLVPHITGFTKTYLAVVCFGKETDTLDPTGRVISTGKAPSRQEVEEALGNFTGTLLQTPPAYSAVHVNGKRASDLARNGSEVKIEPRQIFVYKNHLVDFMESSDSDSCSYALLEIKCSKGTYIRSLARDIAKYLGTSGHLCALRRTQVGPFLLKDAACFNLLPEFTIQRGKEVEEREQNKLALADVNNEIKEREIDSLEKVYDIKDHFMEFTPELAVSCGFDVDCILPESIPAWLNGRPLYGRMFNRLNRQEILVRASDLGLGVNENFFEDEIAVFYPDSSFAGMINKSSGRLAYGFLVPPEKKTEFEVFSWDDIMTGKFPVLWRNRGTALSTGSFDGMHLGHRALLQKLSGARGLKKGIVTFTSSVKSGSSYAGDVLSLRQKLDCAASLGMDFAVVIDFSEDFSKMEGHDFVDILVKFCGMKYMAEGNDFRCGYKGAFTMKELHEYSLKKGFVLETVDDVDYMGSRISSSRIRSAIAQANFVDVQKMLLDAFRFDLKGIAWNMEKNSWITGTSDSLQMLPPDGNYQILAEYRGESKEALLCNTVAEIQGRNIKLLLPEGRSADGLLSMGFIPVTKPNVAL